MRNLSYFLLLIACVFVGCQTGYAQKTEIQQLRAYLKTLPPDHKSQMEGIKSFYAEVTRKWQERHAERRARESRERATHIKVPHVPRGWVLRTDGTFTSEDEYSKLPGKAATRRTPRSYDGANRFRR